MRSSTLHREHPSAIITIMGFTDDLRTSAGDQWNRVIEHKFTKELAANTIDLSVLATYLIQDYRFLDAFVVLLASMIAKCRCLDDRLPGCQFLAVITGAENTYFERSFQALGVKDPSAAPDAPCTTGFIQLMHQAAESGNLGEMLAVLVVCEWSYLSWAQIVARQTVRDENFWTYEWVDLHTGENFEAVVSYLRRLLDQEGQRMTEDEKAVCQERFLQAVQLEEDFFENAYHPVAA